MTPNPPLFAALLLIAGFLFFNLPESPALASSPYFWAQTSAPSAEEMAGKDVLLELAQMRRDYAALLEETVRLRAMLERTAAVGSEQRHTAYASTTTEQGDTSPGVTVYLDTSKLATPAPNQGREWTAVSFREAGQAPDGSKQAVLSISKLPEPQGSTAQERTLPVSHWQ